MQFPGIVTETKSIAVGNAGGSGWVWTSWAPPLRGAGPGVLLEVFFPESHYFCFTVTILRNCIAHCYTFYFIQKIISLFCSENSRKLHCLLLNF